MTLTNLRKWLPIYKTAKIQIDTNKALGRSWMRNYEDYDKLLWGAFEAIIHFGWYLGCAEDYAI